MTPRPNALGYIVLGAFVAAGVYAYSRKARAIPTPEVVDCPIETTEDFARLEAWGVAKNIGVVYLSSSSEPPLPDRSALARSFVESPADLVVVTNDGRFWSYASGAPEPAQAYKRDFCGFR